MQFGDYSINETKGIKSDIKQIKSDIKKLYFLILLFCILIGWGIHVDYQIRIKLVEILKHAGKELESMKNQTKPIMHASESN